MAKSIAVYDLRGKTSKKITAPTIFDVKIRPDVIKRAVVALQSHRIQPQARDVMAGKRTTAESMGVGLGIARIPRMKGRRYPAAMKGAFGVGTVGGRRAYPPKIEKRIKKKINRKERLFAIRSAISATADREIVSQRGHVVEKVPSLPLVVVDRFEKLAKVSKVKAALMRLGIWIDVERARKGKKVRGGKGKMRGRKYKRPKGPLIVLSEDAIVARVARNLPGVDVVRVQDLNAELLAPGAHPGRLTLWTESAFRKLDGLFRWKDEPL